MIFSNESDVTIVVTSCNRFDLLFKTLNSIEKHNSYPIREVILIEDSGEHDVNKFVPESWKQHTTIIINEQNKGQLASIDLAYSHVKTQYIFHCEDDWEFYREGFVEKSKVILEEFPDIVMVWLRDFYHDVSVHYPFHSLGRSIEKLDFEAYILQSTSDQWKGFGFNPGLRRLNDCMAVQPLSQYEDSVIGESSVSQFFHNEGKEVAIMGVSSVKHIGWDQHIPNKKDIIFIQKQKKKRSIKRLLIFIFGLVFGYLLSLV